MQTNLSSLSANIENRIFIVRGVPVMLDSDLANLFNVSTKVLNQTVKRNLSRFPDLFLFKLKEDEWSSLRSQIVTLKQERGQHRKFLPFAFTEQGVAMLSAVLKSEVAVKISVHIIEVFVELRKSGLTLYNMNQRIEKIEQKQIHTERQFEKYFLPLKMQYLLPTKESSITDKYLMLTYSRQILSNVHNFPSYSSIITSMK